MFTGHLHVHTEYSTLDGMSRIEELILKAKEYGQTGIAITDHGSSSGLFEAWKLGKKHDFNVLLGEEFYFENHEDLKNGHLILIAKNQEGLKNIFRLQALAYNNVYYKPRINMEMLKQHHEGLICTTACIANAIGQLILKNEDTLALNHLLQLKQIFGEDFYVELQSTTNPDVEKVNLKLQEFINDFNLKCIVTTDVHYVLKEDYGKHEVLLALQQQKKMNDKKRWRFEYNDYYLKTKDEMIAFLNGIDEPTIEKCFLGVSEIFEKCKGVDFLIEDHLPKFCDSKEEEDNMLRIMTMKGYKNKVCARNEDTPDFAKDLEKELTVIRQTGYSGYFLTVQEYVSWARNNNILVGDGRGSGAGSKVAYTIDITDVNPDKYGLLFERFLTPGREPDSIKSRII